MAAKCPVCGKIFTRKDNLSRHRRVHSPTADMFKCKDCGAVFNKKPNLRRHISTVHRDDKRNVCEICGCTFARTDALTMHLKQHQQAPNYKCNNCKRTFVHKGSLARHQLSHSNIFAFGCRCGLTFKRADHLTRHSETCKVAMTRKVASKRKIKRLTTKPSTRLDAQQQLQCSICSERFSQKGNLNRHISSVHGNRIFGCELCGKKWTRHDRLKSHACAYKHDPRRSSRMKAHRNLKKITPELDKQSPRSKAKIADWIIDHSPQARVILEKKGRIQTKAAQRQQEICQAMVGDLSDAMASLKDKRSIPAQRLKEKTSAMAIGTRVKQVKGIAAASRTLHSAKTTKKIRKHKVRESIVRGDKAAMDDIIRKSRTEKLTAEQRKTVIDHWTNFASHVSTDTTRNTVRKRIGHKKYLEHSRHVMSITIREGHKCLLERHPELDISESLYYKLKPFYIQPANTRDLELCCCQKCVIIRKAHRALMDFRTKSNMPIYKSVYDMVNSTLCPKEASGNHSMACLQMTCKKCGHLDFDAAEISDDGSVSWQTLEYVEVKTAKKTVKKLKLVSKTTSPNVLIEHLKQHLFHKKFALHLFTSRWQRNQWQVVRENLPIDTMLLDMDFSENYSVVYQEEAQSLHFGKTQCTLHSCVVVRPSVPSDNSGTSHVKEYWIMVSDDLKHDVHFVHHCLLNIIMPQLHALDCKVTAIFQRTDNCATQYKSRYTMMDVSNALQDLGVQKFQANYSASGHGKSEVDSAAGNVKTQARNAVIAQNVVITDPESLFQFCKSVVEPKQIGKGAKRNPNSLHARRFFYVSKDEVNRDRDVANNGIKGIQSVHCVKSVGTRGKVDIRELSCYCSSCMEQNYSSCVNKAIVGDFKSVSFLDEAMDVNSELREDCGSDDAHGNESDDPSVEDIESSAFASIFAMVSCNSVVAVRSDTGSMFDYSLLVVSSDGVERLANQEVSEFGHTFAKGSIVVRGNYLDYKDSSGTDLILKRNSRNTIVPYFSLIYCDIQLVEGESENEFLLSNEDHADILDIMSL